MHNVILIFVMLILLMLIFVICNNGAVDGYVDLAILILALALSIFTLYIVVNYCYDNVNNDIC